MLKLIIFPFAFMACLSLSAKPLSQLVWQDKKLAECINKQAAEKGWSSTEQVTEIKCHKARISQGEDLLQFTQVRSLSLFNNQLRKLDLRHLKQLRFLNLANNKLSELHIAGLGKLETLYLFRNKLTRLDLTGLASVKKVRLMQNRLETLDIRPLLSLETGYFFDNQLEDLQITGLDKLTFLDVKQNPMPDELYDFYDAQEGIVISHDGNADDWQ